MDTIIRHLLELSYIESLKAKYHQDIPIGCALYYKPKKTIFVHHNTCVLDNNSLNHAEFNMVLHLQQIFPGDSLSYVMQHSILFVSLEPCALCAALLSRLRLSQLYFGAYNPKGGHIIHGCKLFHYPFVGGIKESLFSKLLQDFFSSLRNNSK